MCMCAYVCDCVWVGVSGVSGVCVCVCVRVRMCVCVSVSEACVRLRV